MIKEKKKWNKKLTILTVLAAVMIYNIQMMLVWITTDITIIQYPIVIFGMFAELLGYYILIKLILYHFEEKTPITSEPKRIIE